METLGKIVRWHCFFEQSGTFKAEFKKLGFNSFDYDILNDYGQTDFQIDIFAEIEKAFEGGGNPFSTRWGRGTQSSLSSPVSASQSSLYGTSTKPRSSAPNTI